MTEIAGTSGPQHDDQHDDQLDGTRDRLDEADDTAGHLMIRTDEAVEPDNQVQDAPRRS